MIRFSILTLLLSLTSFINAQNRMLVPDRASSDKTLLTSSYDFAFTAYVSFPPFQNTGLSFSYSTMTLTLNEEREPTPEEFHLHPNRKQSNKYELKINKEQADALYSLFTSAVYSSSFLGDDCFVMDGTFYTFSVFHYGGNTRSPEGKSNCGQLVNIANEVCRSVKNKDMTILNGLLDKMETLTKVFVSFYPTEIPKFSILKEVHKTNKVKGPSMGLNY